MDYPYDGPAVDPFTRALLGYLRKQPLRAAPLQALLARIVNDTPPAAAALLHTRAHHELMDEAFGDRYLSDELGTAGELLETLEIDAAEVPWLDPVRSLVAGSTLGGEQVFGVHWGSGDLRWFEVDAQGETFDDGKPARDRGPSAAFWRALLAEGGERPEPFLSALFAAAGEPIAAPPPPPKPERLVALLAGLPENPLQPAVAAFGPKGVGASARSAAGRRVIYRRAAGGAPAAVEVLDPDGTRRSVAWASGDVFGVSIHPTAERALLSTGVPGPLLELDLASLALATLHDAVGWTSGYLDEGHVATFTKGVLDIHRHEPGRSLSAPLATLPTGGNNVFVGAGRCFVTGVEGGVAAFRLDGGSVVREAVYPVEGGKLFFVTAVLERDGTLLLGRADYSGRHDWFRLEPAS